MLLAYETAINDAAKSAADTKQSKENFDTAMVRKHDLVRAEQMLTKKYENIAERHIQREIKATTAAGLPINSRRLEYLREHYAVRADRMALRLNPNDPTVKKLEF